MYPKRIVLGATMILMRILFGCKESYYYYYYTPVVSPMVLIEARQNRDTR
jgi:hypothetical protein